MKLLKKLGFMETNEMSDRINFVAVRSSWIIVMVALLFWSLYDFFNERTLTQPFILLSIGLVIYFAIILYMRGKIDHGKQE